MATSTERLEEELAALREIVGEQRARLETLEGLRGNLSEGRPQTRRDLLKLAGAGLVGAAGSMALSALPVAAATGGNFLLGNANKAETNSTLALDAIVRPGTTTPIDYALQVDATNLTNNYGLTGGLNASIHGIEAIGMGSGAGLIAVSSTGPGAVLGSNFSTAGTPSSGSACDLQLGGAVATNKNTFGSGRLGQIKRSDLGAAGPGWTAAGTIAELVRGTDASLWLSTNGASATNSANWRRMNTVRVDAANGSGGFFQPVRIIDTRTGTGGTTGARAAGSTTTWGPFPGTNGIPSDAIGIVGNVTVTGFTGQGFLAVFPAGASYSAATSPSTMNYTTSWAWANAFTVGFGTGANAGKISIYVGQIVTHVIMDVVAYLQ